MSYVVDFHNVSTTGLASSPVAVALAGLRANEARYFKTRYDHDFTMESAESMADTVQLVGAVFQRERGVVIAARPLEATTFVAGGIWFAYVIYESGLMISIVIEAEDGGRRIVELKLSDNMLVPEELESEFAFASQESALAGTVRGTRFVLRSEL